MIKKLSDNKTNIEYVAAYLKMVEDKWKDEYPQIANDPYILATLYNKGLNNSPHSNPGSNSFGDYGGDRYWLMGNLLGL